MMLAKSQAELSKLTQRNAAITVQLQQIQSQVETLPRSEIRNAYNQALDSQQRMLMMRAQLEKLQNDEAGLKKYLDQLCNTEEFLSAGHQPPRGGPGARNGLMMLEKVIDAQEAERQRLSRQMHDGPAQALSNFIVQAEIAARMFDIDQAKAKEELALLKSSAMGTFQKVRLFISELRPMSLDDLGLIPTLRRYVDSFKEETGIEVTLNIKGGERRFEPFLEVMIFRALQELLGTIARQNIESSTKSQVNIQLTVEDTQVKVSVADNSRSPSADQAVEANGLGLKLIRERVELLGGVMTVDAIPGMGSKTAFQIPVEAKKPANES
jgi:two-component system sensor histidine kinase DegS